jgi:hypothetical protein
VAEFPKAELPRRGYHVADVTPEGMVMIIVNHNVTYSNLYVSDIVSEHEVSSGKLLYVSCEVCFPILVGVSAVLPCLVSLSLYISALFDVHYWYVQR